MRSRISLILFSSIFFFWAFSLSAKHQVALFNYYHDLIIQLAYEMQLEDPDSQEAEDLINFCSFHRTLKEARFREGGYYSFTTEEKGILEDIAKSESPVAYNAIAVLNWLNRGADDWIVEPVIDFQNSIIENTVVETKQNNYIVTIAPNPFNEFTLISVSGLNENSAAQIRVYDLTGKEVLQSFYLKNNTSFRIENNGLGDGIYFLCVFIDGIFVETNKLLHAK